MRVKVPSGSYTRTPEYRAKRRELALRHGHVSTSPEGKVVRSPTYISWQNMKARCLYPSVPSYPHYGGRGITFCERWASFENFLADMGERPEGTQLGRVDNDRNYEPGNVVWESQVANLAESNGRRKPRPSPITDEDRAWIAAGIGLVSCEMMADALGVSKGYVSRVSRGLA